SNPTVQPLAQSGTSIPAPAPVASDFSVNTPFTPASLPSVFLPLAFTGTSINRTFTAFNEPSVTNEIPSSCSTSKPVPQLAKTTFSKLALVPTRNLRAWFSPPAPFPINVKFLMVGLETGVAAWLLLLLSASIPLLPPFVRIPNQFSPLPVQPSVQSNKSSPTSSASKFDTMRFLTLTVPPNHSKPSSEPS